MTTLEQEEILRLLARLRKIKKETAKTKEEYRLAVRRQEEIVNGTAK